MNLARGRLSEHTLDIADVVGAIAKEISRSPSQVALAWTLLNPAVTSPIIGARTFAQFEDNLAALDITFNAEQIARLDEVSRIEVCFPHDMLSGELHKSMFGGVNIEKPRHR
jgi:aryl-alcohol dehydrogenase-like predicted oxidoreductase